MDKQTKEKWMKRALFLAQKGGRDVHPNPMVGCVILKNGSIIGEGYHREYGRKHAEVDAIDQIEDKKKLKNAIVFVTLEPCCHFGKTPPCVTLLVKHQVKKVIIATKDVNKKVNGKSIKILLQAGIRVETGICEKESKFLNRRFNTFHRLKRPYIILKWAQTKDGFLNKLSGENKWISSPASRKITHLWRSQETAILVGRNTVEKDNPHLGARDWMGGRNPLRIVLDPHCSLSKKNQIFSKDIETLQIAYSRYQGGSTLEEENNRICYLPQFFFLKHIMRILHQRNILSVLVEGGSFTLQKLIENDYWDECRVFTSQIHQNGICKAPKVPSGFPMYHKKERIDTDILETLRKKED